MPMTISFVSAAVIWRYIYAYAPEGQDQVGLLNNLVDQIRWISSSLVPNRSL